MFTWWTPVTCLREQGLLVIQAEANSCGNVGAEIQKELQALVQRSHASFILDTLEFMHAGGRCSSIVALGANLLHLKPCIQVDNRNHGAMSVGKKYRGALEKVLTQYTEDVLEAHGELIWTMCLLPIREFHRSALTWWPKRSKAGAI